MAPLVTSPVSSPEYASDIQGQLHSIKPTGYKAADLGIFLGIVVTVSIIVTVFIYRHEFRWIPQLRYRLRAGLCKSKIGDTGGSNSRKSVETNHTESHRESFKSCQSHSTQIVEHNANKNTSSASEEGTESPATPGNDIVALPAPAYTSTK